MIHFAVFFAFEYPFREIRTKIYVILRTVPARFASARIYEFWQTALFVCLDGCLANVSVGSVSVYENARSVSVVFALIS